MTEHLVHGPGDLAGVPLTLGADQRRFIWRAYELGARGRRRYRRAVYSRRKGSAKTELAAAIACAELLGPVRCDGTDAAGQPVGVPVVSPYIPCVATSEEQVDDQLYAVIHHMLSQGALADAVDVGLDRTYIVGRPGQVKPVSSSARSREGALPSFCPCDETHLWVTPELLRTHLTLRRNLAKRRGADPWMLETTTAHRIGEGSVAEASAALGRAVLAGTIEDPSLLYDHRAAGDGHDLTTEGGRRAALQEASGSSWGWSHTDAILGEFGRADQWDEHAAEVFERYWLNRATEGVSRWIEQGAWDDIAAPGRAQPGERICLGFAGIAYRGAALIGSRVSDGHLFRLGIWEAPPGGRILRSDVDDAVVDAMERYDVQRCYVDPREWQSEHEAWALAFGAHRVVGWWAHRHVQMAHATDRLATAVGHKEVSQDGDVDLARHISSAHRGRESAAGTLITPAAGAGSHQLTGVRAAILAHEARSDVLATPNAAPAMSPGVW